MDTLGAENAFFTNSKTSISPEAVNVFMKKKEWRAETSNIEWGPPMKRKVRMRPGQEGCHALYNLRTEVIINDDLYSSSRHARTAVSNSAWILQLLARQLKTICMLIDFYLRRNRLWIFIRLSLRSIVALVSMVGVTILLSDCLKEQSLKTRHNVKGPVCHRIKISAVFSVKLKPSTAASFSTEVTHMISLEIWMEISFLRWCEYSTTTSDQSTISKKTWTVADCGGTEGRKHIENTCPTANYGSALLISNISVLHLYSRNSIMDP